MGVNGLITVTLAVDGRGQLVGDPVVRPFGIPVEEDRGDFLADASDTAARACSPGVPEEKMREAVRLAVRRCATLWTGKKPMVDVTLMRISR